MTPENIDIKPVELAFREHSGRLVAGLIRVFGIGRLDLIEDSVQDALVQALRRWPAHGLPQNPAAWLGRVARNRVIDRLRIERRFDDPDTIVEPAAAVETDAGVAFADELGEDVLRMMFACCHPEISADSQVALTLKLAGGFSVGEISDAFLSTPDAVSKLLTRARNKLRKLGEPVEIPPPAELPARLEPVLKALYLVFNEGYQASHGESLIRRDLCVEAIRLARLIVAHPAVSRPKVHAMLALFYFQAARLATRFDERGEIVPLASQARERWDKQMIAAGLVHFHRSASGDELSNYHLEAEIASCHAVATEFSATDWHRILRCYDELARRTKSPIVELNRAIALAMYSGAEAGLRELEALGENTTLSRYSLYFVALGHLQSETNQQAAALASYERASELARNERSKSFVFNKIAGITQAFALEIAGGNGRT